MKYVGTAVLCGGGFFCFHTLGSNEHSSITHETQHMSHHSLTSMLSPCDSRSQRAAKEFPCK